MRHFSSICSLFIIPIHRANKNDALVKPPTALLSSRAPVPAVPRLRDAQKSKRSIGNLPTVL